LRGDGDHIPGYRVVIVTLDSHAAGPAARVSERLAGEFPGLKVSVHAAAEWAENPAALEEARVAVRHGDIIVANLSVHRGTHHRDPAGVAGAPRWVRRDDRRDLRA
jgi:magnesium chelatase subunit H